MNDKYDKQKTLDLMQVEYDCWQRTLAQMTPEQMLIENVQGFWSTKDTVAHLTAWMERAMLWIETAQRGERPAMPEAGYTWDDINTLNDTRTMADRALSLERVLREFETHHQRFCQVVAGLSEAELFESDWNGVFKESLWPYIAHNSFLHFRDHLTPIRQWLRQSGKG